ncbi:MAG: uroporphyrinogen decarboxylase family protein [Firmicutes bacterium]|nr:uroporphyrinogen decarboxylase family protein [Bacillota bacterium]
MNRSERFRAVLEHKKPDKMPFYFPTIACSVASEILGYPADTGSDSLHFHEECSWLDGENAHAEFVAKHHEDTIALHRRLNADILRETWRSSARPTRKLDEYTLLFERADGSHQIKRFYPETQTYGLIEDTTPAKEPEDIVRQYAGEMERGTDTSPQALERIYQSQLELKKLAGDEFPMIAGGVPIPVQMTSPAWLEATLLETDLLKEYYLYRANIGARHIEWLAGQGFRFLNGGGDIASNHGPILSPKLFADLFAEPLAVIANTCRKYGMCYCYRTDGNIWSLMDTIFRQAGVQAYGEVDRYASMTVGAIREQYPELIILGNISSATLCTGTEEEVRRETRSSLEESGGTHYIPGPSNAVVHGTPAANVYAMIEEIEKYRP